MALGVSVLPVEQFFGFLLTMRFLRNSLLFLLLFLPSLVFSGEGSCWLDQNADGTFTIYCEGSGIIYETVYETVYTYGNCVSLKSSFQDAISDLYTDIGLINQNCSSLNSSLYGVYGELQTLQNNSSLSSSDLSSVYSYLYDMEDKLTSNSSDLDKFNTDLGILSSSIDDVNCSTSCPTNNPSGGSGSGEGTSCNVDFSSILEKLNEAQETRSKIQKDLETSKSVLVAISNTFNYVSFLLDQGFGSTTNELAQINLFLSSVTNLSSYARQDWYNHFSALNPNQKNSLHYVHRLNYDGSAHMLRFISQPFSSYSNPSQNYFQTLLAQSFISTDSLISLNNYLYYLHARSIPTITNSLLSLTDSATNYFSFFKSQLSELPVLADYETYVNNYGGPDKYSYYDFLTNHYIQAATGGSLSGNLASKTNWFSRIETLLAALVFSDTQNTSNSVDISSAENSARSITQGLNNINSSASQQSDSLSTSSRSILQVFTSYCNIFDSAALPSSVVLISFSDGDGNNATDVSFGISSNPEFSFMVESFRFITTFAWSAVGIFLLWKFIVWSSSSVFAACKFVYTMITKTFR